MLSGTGAVTLLNPVREIGAVYSYGAGGVRIDYQQGVDWIQSGTGIARTSTSKIPDFAAYTYTRITGEKFDFASEPRNPPVTLGYSVYVDYLSTAADKTVKATPLPKQSGTILCAGDSIAHGAHTVASYYKDSDEQSWCGLLRKNLAGRFSVVNASVPGAALGSFADDLDTWLASKPETVILAFGMNDHINVESYLSVFERRLAKVLDRLAAEKTQVILVGFFQQNERWNLEDRVQTLAYNGAIRNAAQSRGLPFVDAYAAFAKASMGSEQFFHLTGDFMHHPNVYGQRIYYSLLLPYFLQQDTAASKLPDYVQGDW